MEYILIIEPRQQGKTSLVNYLMRHPKLTHAVFVYIDTATLDRSTQKHWYFSLCSRIVNQLEEILPVANWPDIPNSSSEWRDFLFQLALSIHDADKSLIIALDEIGIPFPSATYFFSVLREIYNSRQIKPQFRKLTFMLLGAFHPRDLIDDERVSPFNVAKRIRLRDFTPIEIRYLVSKLSASNEDINSLTKRIFAWTGGQPYLTQQLCAYLGSVATILDVDAAVDSLLREDENHLPPLLKRIQNDTLLIDYLKRISAGEKAEFFPGANEIQAKLDLLGLIKPNSDGLCVVRNQIYERVLASITESTPVQSHIPKRQVNLAKLHEILVFHFDISELRALCFNLNISFEDLSGDNKQDKARELVSYLNRRGRLVDLIDNLSKVRPTISLEEIYRHTK